MKKSYHFKFHVHMVLEGMMKIMNKKGMTTRSHMCDGRRKRNFETILGSISNSNLHVKELISEIIQFKDYEKIYNSISSSKSIASILSYPESKGTNLSTNIKLNDNTFLLQKEF